VKYKKGIKMCIYKHDGSCKDCRSDSKFKDKFLNLYQENLKLKEAIKAIKEKIGIHCKIREAAILGEQIIFNLVYNILTKKRTVESL
jgi:hypothetical protein